MASAFNLTAVLNFTDNNSVKRLVDRANRQLKGGLKAKIDLKFDKGANKSLKTLHKRLSDVEKKLNSIKSHAAAAAASMSQLARSNLMLRR